MAMGPFGQVTVGELEDEDKLDRLRTAVVVKTYSTMVKLYKIPPSVEAESRMRRRVKAFSKALFKNMSWTGDATSRCCQAHAAACVPPRGWGAVAALLSQACSRSLLPGIRWVGAGDQSAPLVSAPVRCTQGVCDAGGL